MKQQDENSKTRIMEAAVKLFAEKGFDAVSIREICKLANINLSMVSYYFGGKKELYESAIEALIKEQSEYSAQFFDFTINPGMLPKNEQIELLYTLLDRFIDFFYSKRISKDLIILLLKVQQNRGFSPKSPSFFYLRETIAAVFNSSSQDRKMIFLTLFIISQINSARILPAFSLKALGQEDFTKEDIDIIKKNIRFYINSVLKEAKIV